MSLKNPVTPPGIDPGTVRLVAQGLNHYATPGLIYIETSLMEMKRPLNVRVESYVWPFDLQAMYDISDCSDGREQLGYATNGIAKRKCD